jgi:hypothetical protein
MPLMHSFTHAFKASLIVLCSSNLSAFVWLLPETAGQFQIRVFSYATHPLHYRVYYRTCLKHSKPKSFSFSAAHSKSIVERNGDTDVQQLHSHISLWEWLQTGFNSEQKGLGFSLQLPRPERLPWTVYSKFSRLKGTGHIKFTVVNKDCSNLSLLSLPEHNLYF